MGLTNSEKGSNALNTSAVFSVEETVVLPGEVVYKNLVLSTELIM